MFRTHNDFVFDIKDKDTAEEPVSSTELVQPVWFS